MRLRLTSYLTQGTYVSLPTVVVEVVVVVLFWYRSRISERRASTRSGSLISLLAKLELHGGGWGGVYKAVRGV